MNLVKNIHPELLAKTYTKNGTIVQGISVFAHCLIVGLVCKEFILTLPSWIVTKYNLENYPFYCAIHDIGKISPGFQEMIKFFLKTSDFNDLEAIANEYVIKHEQVSAEYLLHKDYTITDYIEWIACILRWHHGSNREQKDSSGSSIYVWSRLGHSAYGDNDWDIYRDDVYSSLEDVFPTHDLFVSFWKEIKNTDEQHAILDSDVKYMLGLLTVCDWIGSDESIFDPEKLMGEYIDIDYIIAQANKAINEFGFTFQNNFKPINFETMFPFKPNSLQRLLPKLIDDYGIYIVEYPMGYGKTEAALAAAFNSMNIGLTRGIYYALPTQLTSNSMFTRFKDFVEHISNTNLSDVRLVHSKAILKTTDATNMNTWFKGNKRGTLSQFALGTIDQGLLGVLPSVAHFYLRTFGLTNKCIIIDEIHSYDVYTNTLIKDFIHEAIDMKCVIIALSATLTANQRGELLLHKLNNIDNINHYPLITKDTEDELSYHCTHEKLKEKYINIKHTYIDTTSSLEQSEFINYRKSSLDNCISRANNGQMILWIENTVKESQTVYDYFNEHSNISCGLLNSSFSVYDRNYNEKYWVNEYGKNGQRNKGTILIGTQVCEQSLDIDADYLVTSICPTDMLLQRLGRLHRHEFSNRTCLPECEILIPNALNRSNFPENSNKQFLFMYKKSIGPTACVYSPYVLRSTSRVINSVNSINLPTDIRLLVEKTYNFDFHDSFDKLLYDFDNKEKDKDTRDAKDNLSGGFGNSSDDIEFESDSHDTSEYGTRKIKMQSIPVFLAKEFKNNHLITMHGNIDLSQKKFSIDDKIILNNDSVPVNIDNLEKYNKIIRSFSLNDKITYNYILFNDNISIDIDNNLNKDIMYTSNGGLRIK